ncbi:major facilitator superfamily domain-containing protein [Dichotomocladium elegans]|nr:major facilitator superfamily domain-containing protein [Dichotomocladium elegans]
MSSRLGDAFRSRILLTPPVETDPRLLSNRQKTLIATIVSVSASSTGIANTIYFPGIPILTVDLQTTSLLITLTAAAFSLLSGISPVFWAAASDYFEIRRFLILLSTVIFGLSSIGAAVINTIVGLVVLRCVQAIGTSCLMSVGAGVIADLYPIEERGAAFSKYYFVVFIGPLLGPILGGFLTLSGLAWRSTFWFCAAFAATTFVVAFIFLDETYRPLRFDDPQPTASTTTTASEEISSQEIVEKRESDAKKIPIVTEKEIDMGEQQAKAPATVPTAAPPAPVAATTSATSMSPLQKKSINPFRPLFLLKYLHVILVAFSTAVFFGSMLVLEIILPEQFEKAYGFNSWKIGLSFIGSGLGNVVGSRISAFLSDRLLLRARTKRAGICRIEDRLTPNIWPCGFILLPLGTLLFGWGIQMHYSYWVPIVAFAIQTSGLVQVNTTLSAYIVDSLPGMGAGASAVLNFSRMVFACVLMLVTNPMVETLGAGYTCTLLAGLSIFSMCLIVIVKIYGLNMRRAAGLEQENEKAKRADADTLA